MWYYYSVAFSLSNTRVYFSIFVFSILVLIRVVHLMEHKWLTLSFFILHAWQQEGIAIYCSMHLQNTHVYYSNIIKKSLYNGERFWEKSVKSLRACQISTKFYPIFKFKYFAALLTKLRLWCLSLFLPKPSFFWGGGEGGGKSGTYVKIKYEIWF